MLSSKILDPVLYDQIHLLLDPSPSLIDDELSEFLDTLDDLFKKSASTDYIDLADRD